MRATLLDQLREVTESSALACSRWIGRGNKEAADSAAVECMRDRIKALGISARVLVGEGEKDEAPLLYRDECFGSGEPEWDIAVDPLEGTTSVAKGLSNSMSVIALCETGHMFDPGPSFYMDKIATTSPLKGRLDPTWPIEKIISESARQLDKKVNELNVFVLDKPRHKNLIERLYHLEVKVRLHLAGDVAGAILAALPGTPVDLLLGTGGTPEGLISACAVKSIGGEFIGRLDPQLSSEKMAIKKAGLDTQHWMTLDTLISSDKILFSATGITDGALFDGVHIADDFVRFETLSLHGVGNERLLVKSFCQNDHHV